MKKNHKSILAKDALAKKSLLINAQESQIPTTVLTLINFYE